MISSLVVGVRNSRSPRGIQGRRLTEKVRRPLGVQKDSRPNTKEGRLLPCTTREIIRHMREVHGHETKPHEMERALMRSERIYKRSETMVDGSPMSVWASIWNETEEE